MRNALIPTDFSVRSLEVIDEVARNIPGKLNIFFFHAFDVPGSLLEAMQKTGLNGHNNLVTEDLRLACRRYKMKNPAIGQIGFRIMYGTTVAAFSNFASAHDISLIILPRNYSFTPVVRESVDPTHMFRKSGIELQHGFTGTPPMAGVPATPMLQVQPGF